MTPIKSAVVAASILALAACATPNTTLPPGFTGPSAVISDSSYVYSSHKADVFFVEVIDGTKIFNAKERTERVNFGRGLAQEAQAHSRPIEAKSSVFHIVGQTHYAAPILSMAGTNYFIEGDVTFTPVVDQRYVVKGSHRQQVDDQGSRANGTDFRIAVGRRSLQGVKQAETRGNSAASAIARLIGLNVGQAGCDRLTVFYPDIYGG
jgi:hypothetical protein